MAFDYSPLQQEASITGLQIGIQVNTAYQLSYNIVNADTSTFTNIEVTRDLFTNNRYWSDLEISGWNGQYSRCQS